MFFEQNQISNVLNCSKCSKEFDEPRMLPCGITVCNECISILTNTKKANSNLFECAMCLDEHTIPSKGFPLNKSILTLIGQKPKEVFRGKVVEDFKLNLEIISKKKEQFEFQFNNGIDAIKKHCLNLRCDVHASSEKAILRINELTDSMISEINKYENKCISSFQIANNRLNLHEKQSFEQLIKQADKFHTEWKNYLKNLHLDEESVSNANITGLTLLNKLNDDEIKLKSSIYNNNFIEFKANAKEIEKNIIGSINYSKGNKIQFKETINLRNVEYLKNAFFDSIFIDIDPYGSIDILYLEISSNQPFLNFLKLNKNLEKIHIKKAVLSCYLGINDYANKNRTRSASNVFKKYEDKILTLDSQNMISILNQNFKDTWYSYNAYSNECRQISGQFIFCMNEENIFFLLFDQQKILIQKQKNLQNNAYNYNKNYDDDYFDENDQNSDISYQAYQSTDSRYPFYFPSDIKQFECADDKFIWLNETKLQILNEKSGKAIKSIDVTADKFILDSQNQIHVINKVAQNQKLQVYQLDGTLLREYLVEENLLGQPFFLDTQDKILFFNKTTFDLHLQ